MLKTLQITQEFIKNMRFLCSIYYADLSLLIFCQLVLYKRNILNQSQSYKFVDNSRVYSIIVMRQRLNLKHFSKQQKQHQKTAMKITPQLQESTLTQATRNSNITESQIISHLSSSIEDLLAKITNVTNNYEYSPASTDPYLSTYETQKEPKQESVQPTYKKYTSFERWQQQHSFSTQTHSKVSSQDQKENLTFSEEYYFSPTQNFKNQQVKSNQYGVQKQNPGHWHSMKLIQDMPPKLSKIHSLFQGSGIKEVAESTIFSQGSDIIYDSLQKTIPALKQSFVALPHQEGQSRRYSINDFQIGKEVGSGKFGEVYLCRHKVTGMLFALKKIFKSVIKQYRMQSQFGLQLKILYWLDHPNIVKLYGHFDDQYHVFLLMQYLEGGELISRLGSTQKYVSRVVAQVIDAVEYMHNRGIVHRDIKPQNIVVSFQNTIKLVDFGWAGIFDHKSMKTTFCGTLDYVSPQMKDKGEYSSKVDIWSLGVLTYELLTKEAPFKEEIANWKRKGSHRKEQWDWYIIYPPQISGLSESFMRNLLKENPDDRASLRYCANHFFIRKYKALQKKELQFDI